MPKNHADAAAAAAAVPCTIEGGVYEGKRGRPGGGGGPGGGGRQSGGCAGGG